MKSMLKVFKIISFILVIAFTMASCDNFMDLWKSWGVNNDDEPEAPEVFIVDISDEDESDWDYMIYWADDSSYLLFSVDETEKFPTQMFYRPDIESEEGLTFWFYENGFPHKVIINEHILYFSNFGGNYVDMMIIDPDGEIEHYHDIETSVDWSAFLETVDEPPVNRSVSRNAVKEETSRLVDLIKASVDCVSDGITTWNNPKTGAIIVISKQIDNAAVETIAQIVGLFGGPVNVLVEVGTTVFEIGAGLILEHQKPLREVEAYLAGYETTSRPVVLLKFEGLLSITPRNLVKLGTELTASYSRDTNVTYQWSRDIGQNYENIPGATSNKYTPTHLGYHHITISAPGYESLTRRSDVFITNTGDPAVTFNSLWALDSSG